jgi:PAS domain S-box-containing protein
MAPRPLRLIMSFQSLLVAVLPFLIVALLVIFWLFPQIRIDTETRQSQLAGAIGAQVNNYLESAMASAQEVAILAVHTTRNRHDLERVLDAKVLAASSFKALYTVDRSGRITAVGLSPTEADHRQDLEGLDLSGNPLLGYVLEHGRAAWSDTFLSVIGGGLTVALAVPVGDMVIFGEVEMNRLSEFLGHIQSGEGQLIFVIDSRGQIIADRDGRYTAQQLNLANFPLVREGLKTAVPYFGSLTFEGRRMVGTMIDIPSMNWNVLVARQTDTAFRQLAIMSRITAAGLVAALLLGIGAALILARRLAARFEELARHARRIAAGEDAPRRSGETITEFAQLTDDLQQMADAIRERERQLGESERLLQSVMDNTFQLQGILTPDGRVVDANRTALDLIGAAKEAVVDRPLWETPWWDHDPLMQVRLRKAIARAAAGEFVRFEATHRDAAGATHYMDFSVKPMRDDAGRIVCLIPEGRDITERKQYEDKIKRHVENLSALRTIDAVISSNLDLATILNVLLEQTVGQLQADAACVLLLNRDAELLEYAAGLGFRTDRIRSSRVRLGEGFAGRIAAEWKSRVISDITSAEAKSIPLSLVRDEGFGAYFGVPLVAKGEVRGVLEIFLRTPFTPDTEWLEFAEALAGQAAIAIDNAELFDTLQRSHHDLLCSYETTIEGWARALDLRAGETEGHSRRVTEVTERLARTAGATDEELAHIRRGALLHDIGKLGVPDAILLKPGALTPEERLIVQRHPEIARNLLTPIPFLRPAIDIPYCHHEQWDGSGYPQGLKGEEIPLAARIFAVVDVWDALSSDRPYRTAWPADKVRTHIVSLAGHHFDPEIVAKFLTVVPEESGNGHIV